MSANGAATSRMFSLEGATVVVMGAASGIGSHIQAEAALESFDGRFYVLRVSARDDLQEIGRGTVGRAAVSVGKFMKKSQPKKPDSAL